jgi:carboxylesterase type B
VGSHPHCSIAEWRSVPAADVIARLPQASAMRATGHFYPNIDGHFIPSDPLEMLRTGKVRMPLLIGYNSDECLFWARDLRTTLAGYRDFVAEWFRADLVDEVLSHYPAD